MKGHLGGWLLPLAGLVWLAAPLRAQDARVVSGGFFDGSILEIRFDPPESTQVNTDAPRLAELASLVFRDDGADGVHLIAADRLRGQVLFYSDAMGAGAVVLDEGTPTHPRFPEGLSLDVHDNLYGTSSALGPWGPGDAQVWVLRRDPACAGGCLPGGYAPTVDTLDGTLEITVSIGGSPTLLALELLEDTRVVPFDAGVLGARDLLVLATSPPVLLRYPAAAVEAFLEQLEQGGLPAELEPEVLVFPSAADVDPERRFPPGTIPTGMDFTPEGNLLVATADGTILNYRPDGTRLSGPGGFIDFATGLGLGKLKLAVGPQDGAFRAFVADGLSGEVLRFRLEPDGTGTLDGVVTDPWFPLAIATTTANVVPTPAGTGVTVQPTNLMQTTIESVVTAGDTSAVVFLFEDPREREVSTPSGQRLHRPLFLSEIRADLPPDLVIPPYVRAFRKDDPLLGPPTFLLIVVDTSVDVQGVMAHVVDEGLILGYQPDCADPDPTLQPRLFWVPSPSEPPILESPTFIDVSKDCGTTRGLTRSWSLFLASARDTRPTAEIARTKLGALRRFLRAAQCVDPVLAHRLDRKLGSAQLDLARGDFAAATARLQAFSARVFDTPGAFASCTVNESGELRARADSAVFILQKLP